VGLPATELDHDAMFDDHDHDHPTDEGWTEPTRPPTGVCFVGSFEGRALITFDVQRRPCWLAGEVAAILGLGGASELARRLAIDWAADAREGEHFIRIGALELDELRAELRDRGIIMTSALAEARSALLLLEPGLALAVERGAGDDPQGQGAAWRLLRHVRERVIPDVQALGRPSGSPLEREAQAIARERIELERRRWEYDAIESLCDVLADGDQVAPEVVWAYRVVAAEVAIAGDLWQLKPTIEHGWLSPTQIARRHLGVTPQRVGQVISLLGLRDSKVHSKAVLNKAVGRDRAVVSHLYGPAAVGLIERELRSRGYRRVE
jgi:hypothetical protein